MIPEFAASHIISQFVIPDVLVLFARQALREEPGSGKLRAPRSTHACAARGNLPHLGHLDARASSHTLRRAFLFLLGKGNPYEYCSDTRKASKKQRSLLDSGRSRAEH